MKRRNPKSVWKATRINQTKGVLHFTRRKRNPRIYVETYPRQTVWKATRRTPNGSLIATKRTTGSPRRIKLNKLPPNFMTRMVTNYMNKNNVASLVKSIPTIARIIQPRLNELKPLTNPDRMKIRRFYEGGLTGMLLRNEHLNNPNTRAAFINLANRYYANYPNSMRFLNQVWTGWSKVKRTRYMSSEPPMKGSKYFKERANTERTRPVNEPPRLKNVTNLRNLQWTKYPNRNWTTLNNKHKDLVYWLTHSVNGTTQYKFFPFRSNRGSLRISKKGSIKYINNARNKYNFPNTII